MTTPGVAVGPGFDLAVPAGRIRGELHYFEALRGLVDGGVDVVAGDGPVVCEVAVGLLPGPDDEQVVRRIRVQAMRAVESSL